MSALNPPPRRWSPVTGETTIDQDDHFRARVAADAVNEADAAYWRRRAAQFQWARPRPGEPLGLRQTVELREESDRRLAGTAAACLARSSGAHVMTHEERMIHQHVLPTLPHDFETTASLIARIQRTIEAGDALLLAGDEREVA